MLFYRTLGKDGAFGRSEGALFNKVQNGKWGYAPHLRLHRPLWATKRRQMDANKKLDLVLKWYYDNQDKIGHTLQEVSKDTGIEPDEISIIIEKLVSLGYLSLWDHMDHGSNSETKMPHINFDGVIFYENSAPYSGRPFKSKKCKDRLIILGQWLKTALLFANGIIALLISFWAVCLTNKTNKLEEEKSKLKQELQIEEDKNIGLMDSLRKLELMIDTIKMNVNKLNQSEGKSESKN